MQFESCEPFFPNVFLGVLFQYEPDHTRSKTTSFALFLVQERSHLGLVRFRKQHMVPDVGGLGWRTKTGHLLKNQSYFPQTKVNIWDVPACAGVNTWQDRMLT